MGAFKGGGTPRETEAVCDGCVALDYLQEQQLASSNALELQMYHGYLQKHGNNFVSNSSITKRIFFVIAKYLIS